MIKNPALFRSELEKVNEWWLGKPVKEDQKFKTKRDVFENISKDLKLKRVSLVLGPRRVGKTVLMKQSIAALLNKKVSRRNILYYSLDDPTLYAFTDNLLKDLIDYFLENISQEGKKYIFLDEAHLYEDWYKWIKSYYDRGLNIKFILGGSSSLKLQKEANKYLRGRTVKSEVFPLGFREFLKLRGETIKIKSFDEFEIREAWHRASDAFKEYLLVGGFPEWFEVKSIDKWFELIIDDVPKKAIYEDIAKLFEIKSPRILEVIFSFIAANQSRILAYETINDIAKLNRVTLVNYVEFLKSSYLVIEVLKHAGVKEQLKAKKKFLVMDQGLRNAVLKDYELKEDNLGFIVENVIGKELYAYCRKHDMNLYYWRVNGEVDYVVKGKKNVFIEVKYKENVTNKNLKSVAGLMEKGEADKCVIVSKNLFEQRTIGENKIQIVPAWLFLLYPDRFL